MHASLSAPSISADATDWPHQCSYISPERTCVLLSAQGFNNVLVPFHSRREKEYILLELAEMLKITVPH